MAKFADQQALPAGYIVVGGVCAHAGARLACVAVGDARGESALGKRSIVVVAVKLVGLRIVGHEQVEPAVIVKVEQGDAERFAGGIVEAGFAGDIFESAIAQIVI